MSCKYKNPSKEECIRYIKKQADFFYLPLPLVLATVHIESNFRQFDEQGHTLTNLEQTDFGIMQINIKLKESESDWGVIPDICWDNVLYDWKCNLNYGMQELVACYLFANINQEDILGSKHFKRIGKEEFLARASYSCYNTGPKNIGRYRTIHNQSNQMITPEGYDCRDILFYKIWRSYTE